MTDAPPPIGPDPAFQPAHIERRHFPAIWLIPVVAALIAAYLGWHDYTEHGPLITVTFQTAQGLTPGQTQAKYKDVTLGTVENIKLNHDASGVVVSIRMTASAEPLLTAKTRFWVVRPRFDTFNVSDIETLVSGSYIQIAPGPPGGAPQRRFTGLENPPADRSDEPGSTFALKADKLGSIDVGSPVYFRDINVGEALGYDIGDGFGPITITVFIRKPYDAFVRGQSRFWNSSGVSINLGPHGLDLETHSLRSVLTGGISFVTPAEAEKAPPAAANTVFTLYDDEKTADAAHYRQRVPYIAYFQTSVKDLARGSPVLIYGLQVGQVTDVRLLFDAQKDEAKVRVGFEIQPEWAFGPETPGQNPEPARILQQLIEKGMRVKLESSNLLTGQKVLSLEFAPNAAPAALTAENGVTVLPSTGSADDVMNSLGDIAAKLNQIPFEDIGNNLDQLLKSAGRIVGGADMQQAVHSLSLTMTDAADLARKADKNLTPALRKLPDISAQLQSAAAHANALLTGLDSGYGEGSDFNRSAKHTLDEVNDAARSIRLLADFLERHPEALLVGKSPEMEKKP